MAAVYGRALQLHGSPPLSPSSSSLNPLPRSVRSTRAKGSSRGGLSVSAILDNRTSIGENPEGILSGEWTDNFSLLTYDDLKAFFVPQICREKMCPTSLLGKVMETDVPLATPDRALIGIKDLLDSAPAITIVDDDCRCIGIVTATDLAKASDKMQEAKAGEVMSSPVITLTADKTVTDAAALMLKMKVHKLPILNENRQVIGMVTRSDIFHCLEEDNVCHM